MSTYWGYRCVSHDPPIESEHWLNHGEEPLREAFHAVRAGTWPTRTDPLWPDDTEPEPVTLRAVETAAPIYWLRGSTPGASSC